jgi:CRP-like cAMP-binding protein
MSRELDQAAVAEILKDLPGLQSMVEAERFALAGHFEPMTYDGEVLCREGDPADFLYVLAKGELEIVKRSQAGRDFVVATMTPVCLFGHVGLVTFSGRTATVRAAGRAEVLRMNKLRMQVLLRSTDFELVSPFRRALIVSLARQLSVANQSLVGLAIRAGVAEAVVPPPPEPASVDPAEAERELLKAQGQV